MKKTLVYGKTPAAEISYADALWLEIDEQFHDTRRNGKQKDSPWLSEKESRPRDRTMHRFFSEVEKEWQCDQREDEKHPQIPEVEPHPGEIMGVELDKRASKL